MPISMRMEITKKYTLATRWNWFHNDKGSQVKTVYLVVDIALEVDLSFTTPKIEKTGIGN